MAEYIEREAVRLKVQRYLMPNVEPDGTVSVENAERYFLKLLEDAPNADVVEVVRCKDCCHSVLPEGMLVDCTCWNEPVSVNGFCHRGKRKNEDPHCNRYANMGGKDGAE